MNEIHYLFFGTGIVYKLIIFKIKNHNYNSNLINESI